MPAALFAVVLTTTMLPSLMLALWAQVSCCSSEAGVNCTMFGSLCASVPLFSRGAVECDVNLMRIVTLLTVDLRCNMLAGTIYASVRAVTLVMPHAVSCHV